jgi:hypothetical protein
MDLLNKAHWWNNISGKAASTKGSFRRQQEKWNKFHQPSKSLSKICANQNPKLC